MKHESKDATLSIDDLRKLVLTRSFGEGPGLQVEMNPDESRAINRNVMPYILAGVICIVVAMLAISIVS